MTRIVWLYTHFFINRIGNTGLGVAKGIRIKFIMNRLWFALYECCNFTRDMRAYLLGLPRRKLGNVGKVVDDFMLHNEIPGCISIFIRDLIRYRSSSGNSTIPIGGNGNKKFIKVLFHSKGMNMVPHSYVIKMS